MRCARDENVEAGDLKVQLHTQEGGRKLLMIRGTTEGHDKNPLNYNH